MFLFRSGKLEKNQTPDISFTADDTTIHTLWKIDSNDDIFSIAEFNNYSRKLDNQIRFDRKHHSIAITQYLQIGTTQRVIH